ncbi:MAG: filamentous hemagglutinin N-terminal domain-containing protein [Bdellovibrionaceae bacterium]|nr:filamentous hemagglutinin N-terminal domain-containing protein [Pseudobdellovibrionaceae bacterium]
MHRAARCVMLFLMLAFQFGPALVWANPTGGQVVAGDATITEQGSVLTIQQGSDKAVINWQDFSIANGELTKFLQPSADAMALNKVLGGDISRIYGTLEANGGIILLNPNGIMIGPGGMVNVHNFIGSTLDVNADEFMAGQDLTFMGDSQAGISNMGRIDASQDVMLFARKIENSGTINAGGEAALAAPGGAGSEILLAKAGDDRVKVKVGTMDGEKLDGDAIRNSGEIQAAMVTMKATGSVYATAVNNTGVVRAQGVDMSGGRVTTDAGRRGHRNSGVITARKSDGSGGRSRVGGGSNANKDATVYNSGTLDAAGTAAGTIGGKVEVTGDRVALTDAAVVDVSGDAGGGEALIGGSFQGKTDPEVQNASRTYVGADVEIKADAITSGDGGTAVVWSDEGTQFYGTASARGGAQSGDGGLVEVSGRDYLDFQGTVVTLAPNGAAGRLLLDPTNGEINDDAADANVSGATPFSPTAAGTVLTWSTILTNLGLGNVEFTTAAGFDNLQAGDTHHHRKP